MLSQHDHDHYQNYGWLHVAGVLSPIETREFRNLLAYVVNESLTSVYWMDYGTEEGQMAPRKFNEPSKSNERCNDIIRNQQLIHFVEELLGGKAQLIYDQIFFKPARFASEKPPHQDRHYLQQHCDNSTQAITAWVALADANYDNGGLVYVNGSHKLGLQAHEAENHHWRIPPSRMQEILGELNMHPTAVAEGDVLFHDPLTIHGSPANWSSRPRPALSTHWVKTA